MIAILLLTWLVLQMIAAVRSKDTVNMVVAIIGCLLAVLVCLGVIPAIRCVSL